MLRLKANKTSLYKLVAEFMPLPGIRRVDFTKAPRTPDYWLEWATGDGYAKAFLSTIMGRPLLSVTIRDVDGSQLSYKVHNLSVDGHGYPLRSGRQGTGRRPGGGCRHGDGPGKTAP